MGNCFGAPTRAAAPAVVVTAPVTPRISVTDEHGDHRAIVFVANDDYPQIGEIVRLPDEDSPTHDPRPAPTAQRIA